ncbi:MAG: hypothetical protein WBC78_12620, partial [Candidatus Sulfotelmatobacter sp.]
MQLRILVRYTPSAMNPRPNRCFQYSMLLCAVAFSIACGSIFAQAAAAPSRAAAVLDAMPHAKKIDEVALSPDGSRVAYIVEGRLTVIPATEGSSRTMAVAGNLALRGVAWSSDSKHLAFIADLPGDAPAAQLWTAAADGSSPAKHAEMKGYVQDPRFSPDGSKLAVLFIEGMPRVAGPLQPMTPLAGVIDEEIFEERIATVDLTTDHLSQVTP